MTNSAFGGTGKDESARPKQTVASLPSDYKSTEAKAFAAAKSYKDSVAKGQAAAKATNTPTKPPAGSFGISSITRAAGGPVKGGSSYIVGERGPEIFSPGVSGMITPNHALGGSTNIVVNVDASGSSVEGDEEQGRELGRMISVAIQSELIKQKRPGGMLA